jgi:hypothetical protein
MDEVMQSLVQCTQGQQPDVQVLQLTAHLSQTEGQGTPPLDLSIYIIPDSLIRSQQATKVDLDTTPAHTPNSREVDRYCTPQRQQVAFSKAVATEPMTGS